MNSHPHIHTRTMASNMPMAWPLANPRLVSATQESFQIALATRVGFTRSSASVSVGLCVCVYARVYVHV